MIEIYGTEALEDFMSVNKVQEISKYNKENIQRELKGLSGFTPVCELVIYYQFEKHKQEYSERNGYEYSFDYFKIFIRYKGYLLQPSKKEYHSSTYKLDLTQKETKKDLAYFKLSDYGLDTPPQAISKATEKKMDAWLKYLVQVEDAKRDYNQTCSEKIQKFKDLLKPFSENITWEDSKIGKIHQNGLVYSFHIRETGGAYENIEIANTVEHTLDSFAALSNNGYKQNRSVLLLYTCNSWHENSSRELIKIFSDPYQLNKYFTALLQNGELQPSDIESLHDQGQTQGLELNYMVEEFPLNEIKLIDTIQ